MRILSCALLLGCGSAPEEEAPATTDDENVTTPTTDPGCQEWWYYPDVDGDGYGVEAGAVLACTQPDDYADKSDDCDDSNAAVNPGEQEVCDGFDNDCDNVADESCGVICDSIVPTDYGQWCTFTWDVCDDNHWYALDCWPYTTPLGTVTECDCYTDGVVTDTVFASACGRSYMYEVEQVANEECGFDLYDWAWYYQ